MRFCVYRRLDYCRIRGFFIENRIFIRSSNIHINPANKPIARNTNNVNLYFRTWRGFFQSSYWEFCFCLSILYYLKERFNFFFIDSERPDKRIGFTTMYFFLLYRRVTLLNCSINGCSRNQCGSSNLPVKSRVSNKKINTFFYVFCVYYYFGCPTAVRRRT